MARILRVGVEEFFGGVVHLPLFGGGDLGETRAVVGVFTVFDLSEKDFMVFCGNKVDFVSFGFEVVCNNSVSEGLKIFGDMVFGGSAPDSWIGGRLW